MVCLWNLSNCFFLHDTHTLYEPCLPLEISKLMNIKLPLTTSMLCQAESYKKKENHQPRDVAVDDHQILVINIQCFLTISILYQAEGDESLEDHQPGNVVLVYHQILLINIAFLLTISIHCHQTSDEKNYHLGILTSYTTKF